MATDPARLTRRRVLGTAGAVGLGAAASFGAPAFARTPGRSVAVLGGGMAGLTVAHELVDRGFEVTVYEPTAWGGKARSIPVPDSGAGQRRDLPGEHGFRFFPGFYHHVPDSMRRTPFGNQPNGVWDNLVDATETKFLRGGGRTDAFVFGIGPDPEALLTPDGLRGYLMENLRGETVPPHELAYFVERLMVFFTSCDERRFGQWEHQSWWDFIGAETRSEDYQHVLAAGLTRSLVAAKETVASTRTIGNMGEAFIYNVAQQGNDGAPDRVLDLPTNEAWIDPWVALLQRRGVHFVHGQRAVRYETSRGRVAAVWLQDAAGRRRRVTADWFVSAMPAERARELWDPAVLALDPSLEQMHDLFTDWMVGIQFYLNRPADITRGHLTFIDSPWALTALTQAQFWEDRDFAADYGDGSVVDCLSVDISNWDAPGMVHGLPAKQCRPEQIADEVMTQIRYHRTAGAELPEGIVSSWFLDPGVRWQPEHGRNVNDTPLLVNTVSSWEKRPTAVTAIPNLFLSGDFVQTNVDLATMEGANESGRTAVNGLLEEAGSTAERAETYTLYRNPGVEAAKEHDRVLWRAGLPHVLDKPVDGTE